MRTEHFKKKLEAEKARLDSQMQTVGRKSSTVPDDWEQSPAEANNNEADLLDQAGVIVSRENDAAILADLEARYDTIIEALVRIEKGTYGYCEVCGELIEQARLEANPSATTCSEHMQ